MSNGIIRTTSTEKSSEGFFRSSMGGKRKKFYVVWRGITPGVYETWAECEAQVKNVPNASFKAFDTEAEAVRAYHDEVNTVSFMQKKEFVHPSISVDGATSGNPGPSEYRGVNTLTHEILFSFGPIYATNNIVEFLAIVHAMAYLEQRGVRMPIYSDSKVAIGWVQKGKCKTLLPRTTETEKTLDLVARAEQWLRQHAPTQRPPLLKWDTNAWGEIPADYGRK